MLQARADSHWRRGILRASLGTWLVLAVAAAGQGRLQGKFVTPTGGAVANGTLGLALSQAAVLPGSGAIVPQAVACATSSDGSVVGVPNPVATPVGTAITGIGTLAAGTYFVKLAYTATGSESSLASPELQLALTAAGELQIQSPTLQPAAATAYAVYIGTASGAETLQGTAALGAAYTQAAPLASGTALPGSNTTVCSLYFNDNTIPSFTYYAATLEDAQGNVLPGYPQNWYLAGSTVDVSQIVPLASSPGLRFPYPVLQNPANPLAQSVDSSLNLNQFYITAAGNVGPGFYAAFWAGAAPAANTTLAAWTPNVPVQLRRLDVNAQTAGSGGTVGATITVTDGTTTCTFGSLLIGAAVASSQGIPLGICQFNAGVPLTVKLAGDDHSVEPQNLNWAIEMTAH